MTPLRTAEVEAAVRAEAFDWDDDAAWIPRFRAFSGQRADWAPLYLFWNDLILRVARRLGVFSVSCSEVKKGWFVRGGLTPLCIDRVLIEMHKEGAILLRGDMVEPTSGHLYQMFRRVGQLLGFSKTSLDENSDEWIILRVLLQERVTEFIKTLSEKNWTSSCIITMRKFRSICRGPEESSIILSYLIQCRKAQYLSTRKTEFIEGIKVSLVSEEIRSVSTLDFDMLHLICTMEKLQQQLDIIDQHWDTKRKSALSFLRSGNKQAASRFLRQAKLLSHNRENYASLLDRVEEVFNTIAHTESTKKVSEAIQAGSRAIKENQLSIEEVKSCLQELDETVTSQKQIDEALGSMSLNDGIDDEIIEEDFKQLELELRSSTTHEEDTTRSARDGYSNETPVNQESSEPLTDSLACLA